MLRAYDTPSALTIVVDGPATMTESPAVSAAAAEGLRRGARSLRLDLRGCTAIDSTFSGTLLSLQRQLEDAGGKLTLVSPSAKVLDLLEKMGLDDFYTIEISAPLDAGAAWTEVPLARPSTERLSRMVLDAHDQLASLPGPAGSVFRTVVDEMRRDRARDADVASDHGETPVPLGQTTRRAVVPSVR